MTFYLNQLKDWMKSHPATTYKLSVKQLDIESFEATLVVFNGTKKQTFKGVAIGKNNAKSLVALYFIDGLDTKCANHPTNLRSLFSVCVNEKQEREAAKFSAGRFCIYPHVTGFTQCIAIYSTGTPPKQIHASPEVAKTIDDEWPFGCGTCNIAVRPFGTDE
jgi:hypothetical protein